MGVMPLIQKDQGRRHGSVGRAHPGGARGPWFNPQCGHIGLCAPGQHIGLFTLRQHSCILPRELRTFQPIYANICWQMWVVCCNPAWSYRRWTLSSEVPCIWCSMPGQVKDTTQGEKCNTLSVCLLEVGSFSGQVWLAEAAQHIAL